MRLREDCYNINTHIKHKIIKLNEIPNDDFKQKENTKKIEEYAKSEMFPKEHYYKQTHNIPLPPPKLENVKRNYISKRKPVNFHEKATIVKLDQLILGEINSSEVSLDYLKLMGMFNNESELEDFDIESLLGVSLEQIGGLKEKLQKIMEYINKSGRDGKKEAISIIKEKMNQLQNNIDNIDLISSNLDKIEKIIYGNEKTKAVFREK